MAIQHDNDIDIDSSLDIAQILGSNQLNDEAIHEFLRKMAGPADKQALPAKELRKMLQKKIGEISLSDEVRRMRDEE